MYNLGREKVAKEEAKEEERRRKKRKRKKRKKKSYSNKKQNLTQGVRKKYETYMKMIRKHRFLYFSCILFCHFFLLVLFFSTWPGFHILPFFGPKTTGHSFLFFEGLSYSFASEAPDQAPREPTDGTDGRTDGRVFAILPSCFLELCETL